MATLIRVRQPKPRYDPFARRAGPAAQRPSGAIPRGAAGRSSTDHVIPMPLLVPMRGMQAVGVTVPLQLLSCEDARCEWLEFGKEGEDEGKPFRHPAGAHCGDSVECTDDNCPCPQRLVWEERNGQPTGMRGHLRPDYRNGPTWRVNAGTGLYESTESEVVDRLHDGVEVIQSVVERVRNGAGEYRALP